MAEMLLYCKVYHIIELHSPPLYITPSHPTATEKEKPIIGKQCLTMSHTVRQIHTLIFSQVKKCFLA